LQSKKQITLIVPSSWFKLSKILDYFDDYFLAALTIITQLFKNTFLLSLQTFEDAGNE